MKLVDADGLNLFSELEASRRLLPWLVRRLLSAEPGLVGLSVHIAPWRSGWDGAVRDAPGSAFVPRGQSSWEFSNSNRVTAAATENLRRRTGSPGVVVPKSTSFVFATMRHWPGKAVWAAKALDTGRWRDVRALDSEDLVAWMELHPELHRWATQVIASSSRGEPALGSDIPADIQGFVGRSAEIDSIEALLADERSPRTVVVWGPPGVGKTALTVHAAHRLAHHFPDGQIFLDVEGSVGEESGARVGPASSLLFRLLARCGLEADEMPTDLDDLAAAYRSLLRERSYLVVVDNVQAEAQVRLLDPGVSTSLVLVSSRSRLGGLESALRIEASRLTVAEGTQLLANGLGRPISEGESVGAVQVVALCDALPLALRIAGRMAARHPSWTLDYLARRLQDEHGRLARLKVGDHAVRASFSSAYSALPRLHRRAFRRACMLPGPTFTSGLLHAAMSPDDADPVFAALGDLVDRGMVTPSMREGLYKIHDLLRLFGRECFEREQVDSRNLARQGVGRWLRQGLDETSDVLLPTLEIVGTGLQVPERIGASLSWLDDHFHNLVGLSEMLASVGDHNHRIDLLLRISGYCELRHRWLDLKSLAEMVTESIETVRAKGTLNSDIAPLLESTIATMSAKSAWGLRDLDRALKLADSAVVRAPNPLAAAHAQLVRSEILRSLRRGGEALEDLRRAKVAFADAGNDVGLEMALHNTGALLTELGEPARALRYLKIDLKACVDRGDRLGQAHTMNSMALAHMRLREFEEAERLLSSAAEMCLECHDLAGAGAALNDLGLALAVRSDHAAAFHCHLQDLVFSDVLCDSRGVQRSALRVAHAMICIDSAHAPEAVKLVRSSFAYASERDDRELMAASAAVQAEIGHILGEYDDADRLYTEASNQYLAMGHGQAALVTRLWQLERAKAVDRVGPVERALSDLANSRVFVNDPLNEQDLYNALAVARSALGDSEGATIAKERADALNTVGRRSSGGTRG